MFTVRPHPPKGPSSAPFSSPGGAVVAFGGRFPALFLLLWACLCIFARLLLCTLFLGICAPGLSAVELYFLSSLGSAFSGGRLRRLILLRFFSLLFGASFFLVTSFSSWYFFYPYILSGSVLCFLGHLFFVLDSLFSCRSISLYFFIYFYLFRFVRLKDCGRGG